MELEEVRDISKEFRAGWREAPVHMISKYNNFSVLRLTFLFARVRNTVMHHTLIWQISRGDEILQGVHSDYGGNPDAGRDCFGRHGERTT